MNSHGGAQLPASILPVVNVLTENKIDFQLRAFATAAHHACEAAELLGCPLGAVVKSLVFQAESTGEMVLVLVSGKNRVALQRLHTLIGQSVHPVNPEEVQKLTGYDVGAVPPFGIEGDFPVITDADLMGHDLLWGSAGSANILVGIAPSDLLLLSRGQVSVIKQSWVD